MVLLILLAAVCIASINISKTEALTSLNLSNILCSLMLMIVHNNQHFAANSNTLSLSHHAFFSETVVTCRKKCRQPFETVLVRLNIY